MNGFVPRFLLRLLHPTAPVLLPTIRPPSPLHLLPIRSSHINSLSPSVSKKRQRRPRLDDVERLSRGEPSKSKIGSRSVPHRLNAEERKAYELAKRKGYLVRQFRTREYPLSNTYRNFCDALGWPCVRIDQGGTADGFDTVVVDMSTMILQESDCAALRTQILQAFSSLIDPGTSLSKDQSMGLALELCREGKSESSDVLRSSSLSVSEEMINGEQMRADAYALRFYLPRKEAKHLSEVILDCCRVYTSQLSRKPNSRT